MNVLDILIYFIFKYIFYYENIDFFFIKLVINFIELFLFLGLL